MHTALAPLFLRSIMKKALLLLSLIICFLMIYSCKDSKADSGRLILKRAPIFSEIEMDEDREAAAVFLEDYLNLMFDSTLSVRNSFWQSSLLYSRMDRFLRIGRAKSYLIEHPPKLLGIRKDSSDRFHAKLSFEVEGFPNEILNLLIAKNAAGKFYFIELIGEHLKQFSHFENQGIEFFYSPRTNRDTLAEQKVLDYNRILSEYFQTQERKLRVIICKDLKDYAATIGYDYAKFLNFDRQTGGRTLPDEDLFISANGSPYYPHELVHIYTSNYKSHWIFDEGMATYLGGSGGVSLMDHLKIIAPDADKWDFSNMTEDFYLYENFSARYLIGGLLMKMADEDYGGREAVFKLLKAGNEDEDFYQAVENTFKIQRSELDSLIKNKLKEYKQNS